MKEVIEELARNITLQAEHSINLQRISPATWHELSNPQDNKQNVHQKTSSLSSKSKAIRKLETPLESKLPWVSFY